MRVADVVAQTLANYGIRFAFGIPGGEVLTVIDSLNCAGVRFVLARHETSAAIMAAGASVISGAPGVLVTTLGPGLANSVNGIADAFQEHVPLIVISGVVDHDIRSRYTHQVINQSLLLSGIIKGSFEVENEGAAAVIARAVALATTMPMGPVLIQIAPGTAEQPASAGDAPRIPTKIIKPDVHSDDDAVQILCKAIAQAHRPLLIAGYDAARMHAASQLKVFAEWSSCPVLTTYKAKGVFPENHTLSLGAAGLSPLADGLLLPIVKAADLIILAGYDPIEMRQGWLNPFGQAAKVLEVTAKAPDHGMYHADIRIEGDIAAVMAAATKRPAPQHQVWSGETLHKAKVAISNSFAATEVWGPHAAIAALQRMMPSDATLTVDSGAHRILLSQMMVFDRPLALLQSAGFCTMGAAVPLAIGVKCVDRLRPVIAVLGDGGLEMGLGELATARDEKLSLPIIVFQDESLALIELKQRKANLADAGVRLGRTSYEHIAQSFGGQGFRVSSVANFESALHAALNHDSFTIIVCEIKASDYADRI